MREDSGVPLNYLARFARGQNRVAHQRATRIQSPETLADHSGGNLRLLNNMAAELLLAGARAEKHQLDEKLYLELFSCKPTPPHSGSTFLAAPSLAAALENLTEVVPDQMEPEDLCDEALAAIVDRYLLFF